MDPPDLLNLWQTGIQTHDCVDLASQAVAEVFGDCISLKKRKKMAASTMTKKTKDVETTSC